MFIGSFWFFRFIDIILPHSTRFVNRIEDKRKNEKELGQSVFFNDENTYKSNLLYNIVANNIINDYSKGLETCKVTVGCTNYYNKTGKLIKNWSNKEIFKVGDVVKINKDNFGNSLYLYKNGQPILWQITGRTFRKEGVPLIDLELQEIKQ